MSLFGSTTTASSTATNTTGDISKDVVLNQPPEDSISDLSFSPTAEYLAVASWDRKLRIYEVNEQGQSQGKAEMTFENACLSCSWSQDGTKIAGAGVDKTAKLIDLASNSTQHQQVAGHDAPIRTCRFIEAMGNTMLVTGSWDKTVKYWDLRSSAPVAKIENQERVYSMDVRNKLLVIATADRYINIVNLDDPTKFYKTIQSPLKFQTRVVSCFADSMGFAVGSIEGRCAIQYVEEKDANLNFSFKCHRDTPGSGPNRDISNVYAVNAISFHPQHGTFSTAGSDGTFHFWDKDAKHRLKGFPSVGGTISATGFSRNGNIFAYAVSYDWSKGYAANTQQTTNKLMLHPIAPEEVKPRATKKR